MSQNISIKEGELSRQFGHINKLKVPQSGGGDTLWVPEDEVQTDTLFVDKNGVYDARTGIFTETITKTKKTKKGKKKVTTYVQHYDEDLLCYGWDEVQVNIIDSVSGKGSDGNEHVIGVDDGYLTDDTVPSYIEIVTPPDKTSYILLEPIDTKGMVVKAYYADGTEWGEIPREEYTIEPLVAENPSTDEKTAESDIEEIKAMMPIPFSTQVAGKIFRPSREEAVIATAASKNAKAVMSHQSSDGQYLAVLFASDEQSQELNHSFTWGDKTVYWGGTHYLNRYYDVHPVLYGYGYSSLSDEKEGMIAWTLMYGTIHEGSEVTVKWNRPDDNEELTDSFEIEVRNPFPSGGSSSSGGSSGGSDTPITPPSHGEMQ